jgi:hypothetical protein
MDWGALIGPAVVAAAVSGAISVIGLIVSTRTARVIHSEKLAFDRDLAERKFAFDKDMAERKFKFDRELHDHKRRVELAETTLAEFRQMMKIIGAIRSPFAYGNEGTDRPRGKNETEEESQQKDAYFAPFARVVKHTDFIESFESKRYRAGAILGNGIDEAFQAIRDVIINIQVSSRTLAGIVDGGSQVRRANEALKESCERVIWENSALDDPIAEKVQRAMAVVEKVCWPILRSGLKT